MDQSSNGMQKTEPVAQEEHFQTPAKAQTKAKSTKRTTRRHVRIKRLKGSYEQLSATRRIFLEKRAELQLRLESLSHALIRAQQAHHDFIDEAHLDSQHRLYASSTSFEDVTTNLQDQVEAAMKLMEDLEQVEGDLDVKDAEFVVDAEEIIASVAVSKKRDKGSAKSIGGPIRNESTSPRSKYFSRAGDAKIWTERLQDLEIDHLDLLTERDMTIDRGEPLRLSDEEVRHDYELKRRDLLSRLEDAERDRDSLKSLCNKLDVDIDARQGRRSESSTTSGDLKEPEDCDAPALDLAAEGVSQLSYPDHLVREEPLFQVNHRRESDDRSKVWGWIHAVERDENIDSHAEEPLSDDLLEMAQPSK